MTATEIILCPVYVLLLYLLICLERRKLSEIYLRKYLDLAFVLKVLGGIFFVIYYTALTGGDSKALYYAEGHNLFSALMSDSDSWSYLLKSQIDHDPIYIFSSNGLGYIIDPGNYFIIKLTAILSFFTFGQYLLISLLFGFFALSGLWKLFLFFYRLAPQLHKVLAISILFFPSVIFWSSGLTKDSIAIGALGWFTYSLDRLLKKEKITRNLLIVFIATYLLFVVKKYILLAYAPLFLFYLLFSRLGKIKGVVLKVLTGIIMLILSTSILLAVYMNFKNSMGRYGVENLAAALTRANDTFSYLNQKLDVGSSFSLGANFDGTISGIFKIAPLAAVATFFRPFIWEVDKGSQLLAALESIALIYFVVYLLIKVGPRLFLKYIFADPLIFFCLSFALIFGILVGITTLNFGTLVRYKIPCLPFFAIGLFLINEKFKKRFKKNENRAGNFQSG